MRTIQADRRSFKANDGTELKYLEAGSGPAMVFIPGWSQTADQWEHQISHFSATHRVIALDSRGHGESTGAFGFRISRFAADVNDLLVTLDLRDVTLVGHSMGCSVIWSYWDLYGGTRISHLVLVDQPAVLVTPPTWADGVGAGMSAIFEPVQTYEIAAGLSSDAGNEVSAGLLGTMWTDRTSEGDRAWIIEQNLKFPRSQSAQLLIDHAFADWRNVLPRITVPTLVIAGDISLFPAVGVQWVASQIPGAEIKTFSAEESGSHFMFSENSELFNSVVDDFLSRN